MVEDLLDVRATPRRPQYVMAADFPLNLFHCQYDEGEAEWRFDREAVVYFVRQFQELWTKHQVQHHVDLESICNV